MKKNMASQVILTIMLVAAFLLPQVPGLATSRQSSAEDSETAESTSVEMEAGKRVDVKFSDQLPVLSEEEISNILKLQANSNRSGDVVEDVVAPELLSGEPGPGVAFPDAIKANPSEINAAPGDFMFWKNKAVNSGASTYNANFVIEPSTGAGGRKIFQTGNWFAARSTNWGKSWDYLNPYTIFSDATVSGFCCDQVTLYDPSRDTQFWLLQYSNGLKLALSRDLFTNWCYYNITPGTIGEPATTELDYNDIAIGTRYIYIATNFFPAAGGQGSFILRMPIDSLLTCGGWSGAYVKRTDSFTFKPVQGATDTMYFASNWTNMARGTTMRIFAWDEDSGSYTWKNRTGLPAWSFMYRNSGQNCGSLSGSTVKNWCQFADSRLLGGVLLKGGKDNVLVWSFNAKQDASHPFPYTRMFRFAETDRAYLGMSEMWADWSAFQFASLSPNARGDMAMNVAFGGQSVGGTAYYPSGGVFIEDDYSPTQPWQWRIYVTGTGNTCTYNRLYRWGDYLTVRPYYPAGYAWIATGFAIKGNDCGSTGWYSQWHSVAFGRFRDQRSYMRWRGK